jgi:hypothetical protein
MRMGELKKVANCNNEIRKWLPLLLGMLSFISVVSLFFFFNVSKIILLINIIEFM